MKLKMISYILNELGFDMIPEESAAERYAMMIDVKIPMEKGITLIKSLYFNVKIYCVYLVLTYPRL